MTKKFIKEYAIITFGAALAAAAIYFFMLPSQVVVGSGAALAMVLNNFFPACPVSVFSFSLNMFFLLLGFLLVGREFGAKTVYTCIVIPAVIGIFEQVFADFTSLTNDPFLDILCYILVGLRWLRLRILNLWALGRCRLRLWWILNNLLGLDILDTNNH